MDADVTDDAEDYPEEESRSAHKREAQQVRRLTEEAADLGERAYMTLELPPEVREALNVVRKLKPRSDERRRQLQYAAKIVRSCADFDLRAALDNLHTTSSAADPQVMRLEKLRDLVIARGTPAVNLLTDWIRDIDRNKLRQMIRAAVQERDAAAHDRVKARELYQFLKAESRRAQADIPDMLLQSLEG